jgi:uncharacterized repeat protein (TIGR03806 family)
MATGRLARGASILTTVASLAGPLCSVGGFAALAGCGDDLPRDEICGDKRDAAGFDVDQPFCDKLSTYALFADPAKQLPAEGVLPFTVSTSLFADRADKDRFIVLPAGATMAWRDSEAFELPVGSVLVKTFRFPRDARDATRAQQLIETRLLVRRAKGWEGAAYVYDRNGEAKLAIEGAEVPVDWIDAAGVEQHQQYLVPNKNQCKNCHEETDGVLTPLGPKARHLNRSGEDRNGDDGAISNQLQHWIDSGVLTGAPPATQWPKSAVAYDATSGTLEQRARTWLDISCAHCHNPKGAARTSGLDLSLTATPATLGICKPPVATGRGSAGRPYDIVPGRPDESIIMARLESTEPEIKMPELGRTLVDTQGTALIREWILSLSGACTPTL